MAISASGAIRITAMKFLWFLINICNFFERANFPSCGLASSSLSLCQFSAYRSFKKGKGKLLTSRQRLYVRQLQSSIRLSDFYETWHVLYHCKTHVSCFVWMWCLIPHFEVIT
jgi:hypothetical protein